MAGAGARGSLERPLLALCGCSGAVLLGAFWLLLGGVAAAGDAAGRCCNGINTERFAMLAAGACSWSSAAKDAVGPFCTSDAVLLYDV